MPNYTGIKQIKDKKTRVRVIDGIKALRKGLAEQGVPARSATDSLLLATWNIREFDSGKYGWRGPEAYFYIVEILSHFDLIAIQEVRDGLYPLQQVKRALGSWWDFIVTDVTLGTAGNNERMAYLYDTRKVDFTGLAAEVVIPKARNVQAEPTQFARSPYLASFRAGWGYLTLATVHMYYGDDRAIEPRRLKEITDLSTLIAANAPKLSGAPQYRPGEPPRDGNVLMLGDFNIFSTNDATLQAITDAGFIVPEELQKLPTNVARDKHYDQIAYFNELANLTAGSAGVFDFHKYVYRLDQEADYAGTRPDTPKSYKTWRTYQMSDHLPMWMEFGIDDGIAYLDAQR